MLPELASPACVTSAEVLRVVGGCSWAGGGTDGEAVLEQAAACSLQPVLMNVHRLCVGVGLRWVQKKQVLLGSGKQEISRSEGRWRVHKKRRNDGRRT